MAKKTSIKCPHCKWEYLPAEIFYPKQFLGNPKNIIKIETGEIIGFDGEDMNTVETYCCDHCGKEFEVEAIVTFKTSKSNEMFEEDDDFDISETEE